MPDNPYKNLNTSLFLRTGLACPVGEDDDGLVYLSHITIPEIQYNPIPLLHIWGMLPYRQDLITLSEGNTFELYHSRCGDLARLSGVMLVLVLSNWHSSYNLALIVNILKPC